MTAPSLATEPPYHRHSLAKQFLPKNITSILDVGGISYKRISGVWELNIGPAKEAWGATHSTQRKSNKPFLLTINVTRDYNHERRPDKYYDGLNIPFDSNSFDIATSIDTFEHMPKGDRLQVLTEMIRVAKRRVILVFPFYSKENKLMEQDILDDMKRKNITPKPSLTEHRKYELPTLNHIEQFLKRNKFRYELYFATHRSVLKTYFMLQTSINSLLNLKSVSTSQVVFILSSVMNIARGIFSFPGFISKKDAYRAIFVIEKKAVSNHN